MLFPCFVCTRSQRQLCTVAPAETLCPKVGLWMELVWSPKEFGCLLCFQGLTERGFEDR